MSDPLTKYTLLAVLPVIVTLVVFFLALIVIKFKMKRIIDFVNVFFWDLQESETKQEKMFGKRVFSNKKAIEYVDVIFLYGAANLLGIS